MKPLTREKITHLVSRGQSLKKIDAKKIVDIFFESITDTLISGEDVNLSGFGYFKLRDKSSRPARNPRTGASVLISPRRVVTFHASPKFRSAIKVEILDEYYFSETKFDDFTE